MDIAIPDLRPFENGDAQAFRSLNEEWINKYFALEDADRIVLEDPDGQIIHQGGHIVMAFIGLTPVGCCALIAIGSERFELAKMAVSQAYRGKGIGRKLLMYTINLARSVGAKSLFLGSNAKLAEAIHLYESVGFRHIEGRQITEYSYKRANVFMDLKL